MDLLTVFKFAGILVSGALGILGTLTETRDKTTGRLTRWGNWALRLTIAGFATALCAQIAESLKKTHEDTESRKHTELQLQQASNVLQRLEEQGHQNQTVLTTVQHQSLVAQSSLDSIQKVATRFDTIYVSMFAELPATNQFLTNLVSDLMTMASLDYYRLNLNRDERGEVPEGFSNIGGNIEISLDFLERPFYQHYLPSVKLLRDVFSVLKSPTFDLKLFRASPSAKATTHSGEERGDLEVETFERPPNAGATLRFYRSTGRVAVVWRDVELPRNTWKTNGRIAGISDLGASSMEIQLKYRSRRLSGVGQDMIGTEIEPDYVPPFDPLDGIQVICVCLRFDSYLAGISSGNRTRWVIFRVFCPSQTTFWKVILASVLSISL